MAGFCISPQIADFPTLVIFQEASPAHELHPPIFNFYYLFANLFSSCYPSQDLALDN